jgi:site-specific recombinase XerD
MGKNYVITRDKFLTLDQTKLLLKTCEDLAELDKLHGRQTWITRSMLVGLALRSGLRVSEIANLTHGQIHINNHKDCYLTVVRGKGGKTRDVYFGPTLASPLKKYIEIKQKSWRMPVTADDYLFAHGKDGKKKYTTTGLWTSCKKAFRKAGLPSHYSTHSCRHTYATLMLESTGGDIRAVQKQLGHSNLSMTSLYADVLPARRQELADKLSI